MKARSKGRCAIVGRYQPMHLGHVHLIKEALKCYKEMVIVVGSAQYSHTPRNPFTAGERIEMIHRTLNAMGVRDSLIIPIEDIHRHSLWVDHVLTFLPKIEGVYANEPITRRLFLEDGIDVHPVELYKRKEYCASEIRERIASGKKWEHLVPKEVAQVIAEIDGVRRVKEIARTDSSFSEDRYKVNAGIE